ncbi:hypothetical protein CTU88_32485 [Streptomyces sp. JV178]|uniref:hypothetical protein n=1 Tax=unclassified Streptomyces TaxID=2593676 RepID=UPI000C65B0A2|nr:hypothetical protein [Streptomyces sp. JV178]PIM68383.1 hypothetical protein CTU88_32485 [Streptomyces sp. JV178]
MVFFGPKRQAPHLAPELDDVPLGRVLRGIAAARGPGPQDLAIAQMERLLRGTGDDWDRRGHRIGVLAQAAPALARGWRERRPRDPDALVLATWGELATDPRGALALCRVAADARPADPTPWVAALAALRLLGRPSSELSPVWQEIRARDPWHREAHLQILGYLSPEEQGSQAALRDFLDDAVAVMPWDAPTACLPLTAAVRQYHRARSSGGIEALGMSQYWSQPHTARLLDQARTRWLGPVHLRHAAAVTDLGTLAYALVRAGRGSDAAPVFSAVGGLVTPWPWNYEGDPVECYTDYSGRG